MSWALRLTKKGQFSSIVRLLSSESKSLSKGEERISNILKAKFPQATYVNVEDISGGCGSMYEVQLEAPDFKGKRTVMQHRMVNEALKEELKEMHGIRISTAVPNDGA